MVEQSDEPLLLSFPCYFSHTVQPLGHALPVLCRVHVGLNDVLLSLRPSLPSLRGRLPFVVRLVHRCRVGGGAHERWPPSAAQTARTVFPYAAFTKTQSLRGAREGINPTKFTSSYSPYSFGAGSCFQPPLRQRLNRCDEIRRTIQRSS